MLILQVAACACALGAGACFANAAYRAWMRRVRRRKSRVVMGGERRSPQSLDEAIFDLWRQQSLGVGARNAPIIQALNRMFARSSQRWMSYMGRYLGQPDLTAEGLASTRLVCALVGSAAGLVAAYGLGAPLSGCLVAALLGAWGVSRLPLRMARTRIQQRRDNLEQELPQMLAMVSLGLRGGLSFERSFLLYAQGFDTDFARACLSAQKRWEMSLSTREDALRDLARSYQSELLEQSVESMIRSLHLGTALADNLEALTREARNQYRTACQEAIARAPVKMLVPTGTLILPAMLILVMGPILLEMMGGF